MTINVELVYISSNFEALSDKEKSKDKAKNGTRRAQIPRKPLFLDFVQMNKNAKLMTSKTV